MSAHDKHNALANEFVQKVVRETASHAELMVVIETCILAAMLTSAKLYALAPSVSVEMVEMAIARATDRFAKTNGAGS